MWLTAPHASGATRVVIDLEWVEIEPGHKLIWQIACLNFDAPTRFNRFVLPAVLGELPACATNADLSHAWLCARNAVPCGTALREFAAWLQQLPPKPIILLAHGAFASDMIVMREELCREGVHLRDVVWMDTLAFFRYAFRGLHLKKWSLAYLAQHVLNETTKHDALSDAVQLSMLLHYALSRCPLSGAAYFTHEEPLLLAPGVGSGAVQVLCEMGKPDTASAMCVYLAQGGTLESVPQRQQIEEYLERRWRGTATRDAPCDDARQAVPLWCAPMLLAGGTSSTSTPSARTAKPPPLPAPPPAPTPRLDS